MRRRRLNPTTYEIVEIQNGASKFVVRRSGIRSREGALLQAEQLAKASLLWIIVVTNRKLMIAEYNPVKA